jgi:hypothetical protein
MRQPSETEQALYPAVKLVRCRCGSLFTPTGTPGDNPKKCLPCNRSPWSRLFKKAEPQANVLPISTTARKRSAR